MILKGNLGVIFAPCFFGSMEKDPDIDITTIDHISMCKESKYTAAITADIIQNLKVESIPRVMVETNYMAFCTSIIYKEHLPHDDWWYWNQSNSKVEKLFNNTKVILQKFNPRKKNSKDPRKISYKLWLYSIYNNEDDQFIASFIWCERGVSDLDNFNNTNDFDASME